MKRKTKVKAKTKTIYYAFIQAIEVPENLTEAEIDDFVFKQITPGVDYMWSDEPDLFDLDKHIG
jgi:thiamine biosynthesis protein ThiC